MKEAEIVCLCSSIKLSDLGVDLRLGQTIHVSEERARASAELSRAVKAKGLSLRWVTRCQEERAEQSKRPVVKGPGRAAPIVLQAPEQSEPDLSSAIAELKGQIRAVHQEVQKLSSESPRQPAPETAEANGGYNYGKKRGPKGK